MNTMIIQYIVIGALFLIAVFFLVRRVRGSLTSKGGCAKGCGTCGLSEKPKKAIY